ncbi:MAG: hypothetical protein CALGDGBN_02690 [Pseudomonadales bacterium]|nr:hypothetical protein [Pseudomonadales bacterium]
MVSGVRRVLRHLLLPPWRLRRVLPPAALHAIEAAISDSERWHRGQICFAVESALDPSALLHGLGTRGRALQVFAELGVWDTEDNSGVLIYVLLADHDVEIVADRGIAARVDPARWEAICAGMERAFAAGDFGPGALAAIVAVGELLREHYPGAGPNTVADAPVVL